jgi:hypothetical protein
MNGIRTRSQMKFAVVDEDARSEGFMTTENADKQKKLADQIQDAGGVRNWLVDELMRDRTEQGDAGTKTPGLEEPQVLSPAAKERLRRNEELNAQVVQATRSAGVIITLSCLALLYLAKEQGLAQ